MWLASRGLATRGVYDGLSGFGRGTTRECKYLAGFTPEFHIGCYTFSSMCKEVSNICLNFVASIVCTMRGVASPTPVGICSAEKENFCLI